MKNIIKGFGLVLAMFASSAQAIPTLFFDGSINYNASAGLLSVTSVLTNTTGITPAPALLGSSLDFSASYNSTDTSNAYYTVGIFGTTAGTDLTVIDGALNTLLTGNFSELTMKGGNQFSSGLVSGILNADGGSLQNEFGIGNLIALEFNLSTTFGSEMCASNFTGVIDGRIEGASVNVPEPTMSALLALGLLFIGFVNKTGVNRNKFEL